MVEQQAAKAVKDQLRKAIDGRKPDEIDDALAACCEIEGFADTNANQILIQWADRVKQEAFDVVDTSTWTQKAREEYSEYELRKASNSRDIKVLFLEDANSPFLPTPSGCFSAK